jgi:hypothetical protein
LQRGDVVREEDICCSFCAALALEITAPGKDSAVGRERERMKTATGASPYAD